MSTVIYPILFFFNFFFQVNINTRPSKSCERSLHSLEKEANLEDVLERLPADGSSGGGSRLSFPYIDGDATTN